MRNKQNIVNKPGKFDTPTITPTTILQKRQFFVKGSIPYWDQENAYRSFQTHTSSFDYVNLFWYYAGTDGAIEKYQYAKEDPEIITYAHEHNVQTAAVITNLPENGSWDSSRVEDIIDSETLRSNHIQQIVQKLDDLNFDGVIIDYEDIQPSAKEAYTLFVRELSTQLHINNKFLTVVLHTKTGNNLKSEKIGAFQDWKKLSLYADQLQIMGYSEHWDAGEAGPIASIPWLKKIIKYVDYLNIPKGKVFLGIPVYGYDWDVTSKEDASALTFEDTQNLLETYDVQEQWDGVLKSPHFSYEKDNHNHEVWFENAKSMQAKVDLAYNAGLAGVTFWRLGEEDPEIWSDLRQYRLK